MTHSMHALGLYLHIPFCERKCPYCGFPSVEITKRSDIQRYMKAAVGQIRKTAALFSPSREIDTIFIGGGTPSLLSAADIANLLSTCRHSFHVRSDAEITMEANPNSLQFDQLTTLAEAGVNRISIGVQSFQNDMLHRLGRRHCASQAIRAVRTVQAAGRFQVSLDLMFGLPGQTPILWEKDLETALSLRPDHLSFYSLQLEERTPFYQWYREGEMDLPDNDTERAMYHTAVERFRSEGYQHYEISNCCLPGKYCRHNLKYWNLEEYLGIGPGAVSWMDATRARSITECSRWCDAALSQRGNGPLEEWHKETIREQQEIYCFTALRTSRGIDLQRFRNLFHVSFQEVYAAVLPHFRLYRERGLLQIDSQHIVLTERGIDCSNEIMCELIQEG